MTTAATDKEMLASREGTAVEGHPVLELIGTIAILLGTHVGPEEQNARDRLLCARRKYQRWQSFNCWSKEASDAVARCNRVHAV